MDQPLEYTNNTAIINNDIANLNKEGINVFRLERLSDKKNRLESHRLFLKVCLEIKRIPNGLVIDLEPSIGNHDEDFRPRWYQRLLREDCKRNSNKDKCEHDRLESTLNNDIKDTLKINSENRKGILKNSKHKKFNYLKYHRTSNPAQKANQTGFPVLYNNTTSTTRHNKTSEEN